MKNPSLLIYVPAYNGHRTIRAALESLQQQEGLDRISQVVISDDASVDDTCSIARAAWQSACPLEIRRMPVNIGHSANWNFLFALTPTDWVVVLEQDDIAKPHWLETLLDGISNCADDVGAIFVNYDTVTAEGLVLPGTAELPLNDDLSPSTSVRKGLMQGPWNWNISGSAIRTAMAQDVGPWNQSLPRYRDWHWLIRCWAGGWRFHYVSTPLIFYGQSDQQQSSRGFERDADILAKLQIYEQFIDCLRLPDVLRLQARLVHYIVRRTGRAVLNLDAVRLFRLAGTAAMASAQTLILLVLVFRKGQTIKSRQPTHECAMPKMQFDFERESFNALKFVPRHRDPEGLPQSDTGNRLAILIRTYNAAETISETLKSIQQQGPWLEKISKVLLLDDCSTDSTCQIARATWDGHCPLEIRRLPVNVGEAVNSNLGFACLRGDCDWVLILDHDDLAKPIWLETLYARIERSDRTVALIGTDYDVLNPASTVTSRRLDVKGMTAGRTAIRNMLVKGCWWLDSGSAIRTAAFSSVGPWDSSLPKAYDADWMWRCLAQGWTVEHIPLSLIVYRPGPRSLSVQLFEKDMDAWSTFALTEKYLAYLTGFDLVRIHAQQLYFVARRMGRAVLNRNLVRFLRLSGMAATVVFHCLNVLILRSRENRTRTFGTTAALLLGIILRIASMRGR